MASAQALLKAYLRDEGQPVPSAGWGWLWRALRVIAIVALAIGGFTFILWHLWRAWQLDQWEAVLLAMLAGFYAPVAGWLLIPRAVRLSPEERLRVAIFRRAIMRPDARYTLPAPRVPSHVFGEEQPLTLPTAESLWSLKGTLRLEGVLSLISMVWFFPYILWNSLSHDLPADSSFFIVMIAGGAALVIVGLVAFVRYLRAIALKVALDEVGVRWRSDSRHLRGRRLYARRRGKQRHMGAGATGV